VGAGKLCVVVEAREWEWKSREWGGSLECGVVGKRVGVEARVGAGGL
jgi:hypothetical protein